MRRTWVRRVRAVAAMSAVGWLAACQPVLTGQEFKDFYDRYEPPPATTKITSPPAITGDPGADQRIWSIALQRRKSNELDTTDTELMAIAAPAITGLSIPKAASASGRSHCGAATGSAATTWGAWSASPGSPSTSGWRGRSGR